MLLMTLHLPISTLEKLQKARGALEAVLQLVEISNVHVCVYQGVSICTVLLARHVSLNSGKTKKTRQYGHSYCTAWLPGALHASVAVETQHRLSLEGDNKPCFGGEGSFAPQQQGW